MELGLKIVESAREELKTKFVHQGRCSKVGLDCAGLCVISLKKIGIEAFDASGYHTSPNEGVFISTVEKNCNLISFEELKAGDFLTFGFGSEAQHIAIVTEVEPKVKIIHALSRVGYVTEHDLDATWKRMLKRCYRLKNIEE